jgi:outer membrane protein insertion porin family
MRFPGLTARVIPVAWAIGVLVALAPAAARAVGEEVTDVRVLGNVRTEESTIRSIAGVTIGDTLGADTLDMVRERLANSGLFADVNVWWEQHGAGVRVNISVRDKFPWAPVPTASWSENNKSIGVVFVHGNLFGRGKQLVLGARLAQIDSGVLLAYRDPSMFGSWFYWQLSAFAQRQVIPEFDNSDLTNPVEIRETTLVSYGVEPTLGIAWLRRVKTQVGWHLENVQFRESVAPSPPATADPITGGSPAILAATKGGLIGVGRASLSFDFRAREFAVMTGAALTGNFDYGTPGFGSDFTFWRAGVNWEEGIRLFRAHNFIYSAGAFASHNAPFFQENTAGGTNLRGYLFQEFRGDTQLAGKAEYHFPLFSIGSLDFRALGFYDFSAIWFRQPLPTDVLPPVPNDPAYGYLQRATPDQRTFMFTPYPSGTPQGFGFSFNQSIHNDVGVGLRFFLRSVAVPLVGIDAGYGIEAKTWRYIIIVGA